MFDQNVAKRHSVLTAAPYTVHFDLYPGVRYMEPEDCHNLSTALAVADRTPDRSRVFDNKLGWFLK